jgi:hypothetical protein
MQSETDWTRIELELLVIVRESVTKRLAACRKRKGIGLSIASLPPSIILLLS